MSEKFYFTFPCKYLFLADRFVIVEDSSRESRLKIFNSIIKGRFAFQYSEKDWIKSAQEEKFGLREINIDEIPESYFYYYGYED